ncbi:MAG TPA: acetate/propionate family kinase [Planctomycetales bacterium]|jgi:acetate kinase|nr:acetate/propionate family kinase [Planctomycetales bacterium]
MSNQVLTINGGSSSIKFALFASGEPPHRLLAGSVERVGLSGGSDHEHAVGGLFGKLEERFGLADVGAVGHRVVHGGARYTEPQLVNPELLDELRRIIPLDPVHLPGEIELIEAFRLRLPDLPQIACFDTAFHHDMPRIAQMLPLPRRYDAAGIRRYGFHGLSYAYLMEELARIDGPAAQGRVVLAHLGAGASLAAVRGGQCLDTTMGFTPTAGLIMATRSGDLDPGLLVYMIRNEGMNADQLEELVNRRSGFSGVSEGSPDMRDLVARESGDPRAAEAIALFCYHARKWIGAMAAALGGLDTLVFAGGIGENSLEVRSRICADLGFLGVHLNEARNAANEPLISVEGSPTVVRVIRTDEESMIARSVCRLLGDRLHRS